MLISASLPPIDVNAADTGAAYRRLQEYAIRTRIQRIRRALRLTCLLEER